MAKQGKKKNTSNLKGTFTFKGLDNKEYKLTYKEKLFCETYLDFKGNGTSAAMEVYDCANYKVAGSVAYENLRKPQIFQYVNTLLDEYGFSDENVKKQHLFILNQMADLAAKNKGIDMFYKLKGEYAPEKKDITGRVSLRKLFSEIEDDPD